ncbi:MAG: hypothetical protein E7647_02225 [Ruminococcaceae bacterium]|nr:hypothetical protein [Oscillospiraceae bacterium]
MIVSGDKRSFFKFGFIGGRGNGRFFEKKLRKKLQYNKDSEKAKANALGEKPENEQAHFRVFPALAGAVSAAGLCPATFAL